ncbi:MAG: DUF6502 family protein [Cellvibrionaceae bacterium]
MNKKINAVIAASTFKILCQLIKILIRQGVAYGTFAEWARKAYADMAYDELTGNNKKATITSVSALTGLTRKETKRLNDLELTAMSGTSQRYNRAIRVISGWTEDTRFHNPEGKAASLPIESTHGSSFADLVKDYSGDMTTVAMLDLLLSAKCIEANENQVKLVKQAYIPQGAENSSEKISILGTDVSELLNTINHNLNHSQDKLFFQRKVSNTALSKDKVEAFKTLSSTKSQALLEELNHWLTDNEVDLAQSSSDPGQYVAVGIYYSEHQYNKGIKQ